MNLIQALDFEAPLCAALVGAGGKTTALFALARQVSGLAWVSTSAHLGTDQTPLADRHYVITTEEDITPAQWLRQKVALLSGPATADDRLNSPAADLLEKIHQTADRAGVSLLLESDGSRSIPLKAPGEHEPPIPAWVRQVVVVVGSSMIGKPLSEKTVYRASRFAELTGLTEGETVTIESLRDLLLHPKGGLKNIPAGALKAVLFNQADTAGLQDLAGSVACDLLEGGYDRVVVGGLKSAPDELLRYART